MHAARCQYVICIARRTAEQCPDRIRYRAAMPSQHVLLTSAWGHHDSTCGADHPFMQEFQTGGPMKQGYRTHFSQERVLHVHLASCPGLS